MKKGVSPVIATVLLIGIVIVLISIVWLFMMGFKKEAITKFGNENIELTCQKVDLEVEYLGNSLIISNNGEVPIAGIKIKKISPSESKIENLESFNGLISGESGEYSISIDNDVNKIIVYPVLRGNSNSGVKDYMCENGVEIEI